MLASLQGRRHHPSDNAMQDKVPDTADTVEPRQSTEMLLAPHLRAGLVDIYRANESTIKGMAEEINAFGTVSVRSIRRALGLYLDVLYAHGLVAKDLKQSVVTKTREEKSAAVLLGVYHRFNCMLLRGLAGKSPCSAPCCCDCSAIPAIVACVFPFLRDVVKYRSSFKAIKN